MTKDEALKLGIESLEWHNQHMHRKISEQAIAAMKKALMSHSDEAQPEQEPVATDWERIARVQNAKLRAMCDEAGGFEKLCEVMDKYERTTPPPVAESHKRKPLTNEEIWVLTSEYNDYDQHGEYFEAVFIGKPTSKQIQKHCHVTEQGAVHILNGGGRVKYEDQWYNLRKEKAAHGIKELKEYKK